MPERTACCRDRCLLAKMYNAATEVLLEDVYDVDPQKTAVTPTDFFLYCYYGGMLAAGLLKG